MTLDLMNKARATVADHSPDIVRRAASFMLLADSRASYEIEGDRSPRNRLERWGAAVLQSGQGSLTWAEILRLQTIVLEDTRLVKPGLRTEGVYLGDRDQAGAPIPEFIGARPEDLPTLIEGWLRSHERMGTDAVDPILHAAASAFGFVYIHPLQDGNGRIHRCLIQQVLAQRGMSPPGILFPVSAVMLDLIETYRSVLRNHTGPLMPHIQWEPTPQGNVSVQNRTADLYRYYDATEAVEFLYACVARAVEVDFPREIDYLVRHDRAIHSIREIVPIPEQAARDLILFIRQNKGTLPRNRRKREFVDLSDQDVAEIQQVIQEAFEGEG
jgi:phage gpG-like protein